MIALMKRNLLVFFKDKSAVFFSLLAVFIIIGLYALFLGDVWTDSFSDMPDAARMVDLWIVSGLLATTSVTTTMGAFGTMINDKTRKIDKDFHSAPLTKTKIAGGYILSSYVIGVIMTFVTLILSEVYVIVRGGELLSLLCLLQVGGVILLTTLASTSLILFIVTLFESENAFSTASTIIGTLIGFLMGIYLPIGQLPSGVQTVIKAFPISHGAVLIRQFMMENVLDKLFLGAPPAYRIEVEQLMGITYQFGDKTVTPFVHCLILVATTIVFFLLSVWRLSGKKHS